MCVCVCVLLLCVCVCAVCVCVCVCVYNFKVSNTLIAHKECFLVPKYTHHTFTPIIKHLITTANKHPGKKSFIDKK